MTAPHIGMKVWRFDENRRVYARNADGKASGGPIWREHWVEAQIIGETRASWLIGHAGEIKPWMLKSADKIAKRDWPADIAVSQEDIDRKSFVEDRWELAHRVQNCRDYDTLKAIEAALDAQIQR